MKSLYLTCFAFIWLMVGGQLNATPPHPRLLVTADDWKNLPARNKADPNIGKITTTVISRADRTLKMPILKYERQGRRILSVSRDAIQRVLDLSMAWKLTQDKKYLDRCRDEMLAISSMKDWNPDHHLDTAEMQTALAIGYDWLFHDLTENDKSVIVKALIEKGLQSTLHHDYVLKRHNNWNQVCAGGLVISAIALQEIEPKLSKEAIDLAMKSIPTGLKAGYPADGAYAEGGGYWSYGTEYTVLTIEALRTSGLPYESILSHPGFLQSGYYIRQVYGNSRILFNYGDNRPHKLGFNPVLAWMAKQNNSPTLRDFIMPTIDEIASDNNDRFLALSVFWLPEKTAKDEPPMATHFQGSGLSPIAIHRTGFGKNDLYLGIKAGRANVNHGHMDAGSFVIDHAGKRWASDLGVQSYHPLESQGISLFDMTQNSDRWKVFRLNNFSHNTLTYNGQLHNIDGSATIISSKGSPAHQTVIDLTAALGLPKNAKASRDFRMDEKNKTITITDSLTGLKPGDRITWNLFTPASVKRTKNGFALSEDRAAMELELSSPQSNKITSSPADPPPKPHDEPNPGITRLQLEAAADKDGKIDIKALFKVSE